MPSTHSLMNKNTSQTAAAHGRCAATAPVEPSVYQYEAIPSLEALPFTRILELAPGEHADPLQGTLSFMSVNEPGPFEALSYVGGRGIESEAILCNGKPLQITRNLTVALRRLRDASRPRTIWVDQVCINQKDLQEKSQQVQHMNSIYQKASRVLVWLGLDYCDDARRAFSLTKSLAAVSEDPAQLKEFRSRLERGDLDQFPASDWASLGVLFKLPYFDRKWILQEIGTDAPKQLLWGDADLEWPYVFKAAELLRSDGYALRRRYDLLVWKSWYMTRLFSPATYETKALNFTYELHRARWQQTGDPRDHIFALLGHPSAQVGDDGGRVIQADYTKTVDKVYHEFVVRMLERDDCFMILNTVQHASPTLSFNGRDLPTWVTQWDSQEGLYHLLGDDTSPFQPSGNVSVHPDRAANLKFHENNRVLSIDGVVIDTIAVLGDTFAESDVTLESHRIPHLWLCQPEMDSSGGNYVALAAFLETLLAIKARKGTAAATRAQRISDGADFLTRAAANNGLGIGSDIFELARGGDYRNWMECVFSGAKGRRFARGSGDDPCFALCPPAAVVGDVLCVVFGALTPFCLRPSGDGYLFVGECYVEGFMDGSWLDVVGAEAQQKTFMIR